MTWHWVTYSSFVLNLAAAGWCATISGRVEVANSSAANSSTAGARESDHSGVVVWLEPLSGELPQTPPLTAVMAHKKKTFVPHLVAIRTGSKVSFPNLDPFFHNAFSNYDGQIFDIGLHPPGSAREVTFRRPGIVRLFCNIHPSMSAVVVVLDTPFFAVSDAAGAFVISNVTPGSYRLKFFHERALPAALATLEQQLAVQTSDIALPPVAISEAGYLAPPHKNKYGKDYPPVVLDQYPGPDRKR